MTTITLSPKFQVVIPKEVREALNLGSGMRMEVIPYEDHIELIPLRPIGDLKGILKGMDTVIKREKDRL
jgi:AbrB family looped-hinge helix DNA binding protein